MGKCYFELRKQSARGTDSMAADIMRHLHTRQHLGKAVIVTDQSVALLAAARKQWLKLARTLQKQRASTLNADKILKFTHTITHMQHMRFTVKTPLHDPEADVYFVPAAALNDLQPMPHCYSAYLTVTVNESQCAQLSDSVPFEALIIDYLATADRWRVLDCQPKRHLELQVDQAWQQLCEFITSKGINVSHLIDGNTQNVEAMDDALDTLLGTGRSYLQVANEFQHALELARPLRISKDLRQHYDALILLAHRVQALMPGTYSQQFLEAYNEDDTIFLYELGKTISSRNESLSEATARHLAAGRRNLATSLQRVYGQRRQVRLKGAVALL